MALPLSGTNIRLISGVPFTSDYKDTRWFNNTTEQLSYFNNFSGSYLISDATFQWEEKTTRTSSYIVVKRNAEQLDQFNYLYFNNSSYSGKYFYAFIDKIVPASSQTSRVYFTIDVIQTWMFDITFKESLVVKEHDVPTTLTNYVNPIDEGLDYGSMYDTVHVENVKPNANIYFLVVVAKERMDVNGDGVEPSLNGAPQPLTFYVHPFTRNNGSVTINIGGASYTAPKVDEILKGLYKIESAVNNIVSLYVTDYFGESLTNTNNEVSFGSNYSMETIQDAESTMSLIHVRELRQYGTLEVNLGNKYTGFTSYGDNKLYMYPYCVTLLVDGQGNQTEVRNEFINGNNLILQVRGSLGLSQKTSYAPLYYNYNTTVPFGNQVNIENALINNAPNDVPIITDLLSAYLQGNRNSLATQESSVVFNGAFGALNSALGAVGGAVSGAAVGGLGGAVAGGAGALGSGIQGVGNSLLQLEAMESKRQDIANVPANITKQGSDSYYTNGYDYKGCYVVKKQIKPEYAERLAKYFKTYGYKTNKVKVPNIMSRQSWNYVQLLEPKITGQLNTIDMNRIKSIFQNGITLWHVNDIGNYSLSNGGR